MADYFDIGVIVKPQGIKGELRVYPVTDDPRRFAWLNEVTVEISGKPRKTYTIEKVRNHQSMVILKLAGINDRTAAEGLTGGTLKIPPDQALPLDTDEYYIRDLIDMAVWTEEGELLGRITQVLHTGANDVYEVKSEAGSTILIPAIKSCIVSVAVAEKKMTVRLLEGLRD